MAPDERQPSVSTSVPFRRAIPAGPSNSYAFSTAVHGIRRRSAASASRARVKAFCFTSSCSRAPAIPAATRSAVCSWRAVRLHGRVMLAWLTSFLLFTARLKCSDGARTFEVRKRSQSRVKKIAVELLAKPTAYPALGTRRDGGCTPYAGSARDWASTPAGMRSLRRVRRGDAVNSNTCVPNFAWHPQSGRGRDPSRSARTSSVAAEARECLDGRLAAA